VLTAEQIEQYRRSGFVNGGPVLDDAEVEALQDEVLRVIDDDRDDPNVQQPVEIRNLSGNDTSPIWQIINIWQASPAFRRLIDNDKVTAMAAQLSGARELRVWHDQVQYKPQARGGRLQWHQDSPAWPTLQPKTAQISAWIALDDAEADNGCMYMVPGSHKWGNQEALIDEMPDGVDLPETFKGHPLHLVMCPVKRGHVHFHHSLTWHGSGANHSNRLRRAIAIHFMTEQTTYDQGGQHSMKAFIDVPDGAQLTGETFPLVWSAAH
jgi:phytanoyl-CoA hydroxylase